MTPPAPDPRLIFGRALRRARRERELSQEALGDAAGIAGKYVSEIERANRDPRLSTVVQLAHALDVRLGELLEPFDEGHEARGEGPGAPPPRRV